jgi:hypothetical protein
MLVSFDFVQYFISRAQQLDMERHPADRMSGTAQTRIKTTNHSFDSIQHPFLEM